MSKIWEEPPEGYSQEGWDYIMGLMTIEGCKMGAAMLDVPLTAYHMMHTESLEAASILWMGQSLRDKLPK